MPRTTTLPRNTPRDKETPIPKDELKAVADAAVKDARSMLAEAIEDSGATQAILAERLSKTRSNMAQVLSRGEGNPTIRTVATWLHALGFELVLDFHPIGEGD